MEPPKAVIFDLLTALIDSWSVWDAAAGSMADGRRWRARYLELTYGCGEYKPYEELVAQAALEAGLSPSAPAALIASWGNLKPWPEAASILSNLRARGLRLGVITNCSIELGRRAATVCWISFDVVLTAEEVGFYKPHPQTYKAVLSALGVQPNEALFVAGSSADVPGAAAVGMKVVWHNRAKLSPLPGASPLYEGYTLDETLGRFLWQRGSKRSDLPTPSLYLNRQTFTRNCRRMYKRAVALNAKFRVHIKSHKTVQGTAIEVRELGDDGRIICSTLKEIEHAAPLIKDGTVRSVLYGVPPAKSYLKRLTILREELDVEIILMIDHLAQVEFLQELPLGKPWPVFVKIDCGTHRSGLEPMATQLPPLLKTILDSERIRLHGFYAHSGHSYGSRSVKDAEEHLLNEIACVRSVAEDCLKVDPNLNLVLSVGATPTAHAASMSIHEQVKDLPGELELHAGNFSLLDLQQVSTGLVKLEDVAVWIEAEVSSIYSDRGEILVNVGCLGLGREPGEEAGVWGRAMILPCDKPLDLAYNWNVVRLSQEHGILAPRAADSAVKSEMVNSVVVGSRVRIIPQHTCVAGAMYHSYNVVDEDDGDCIDEWIRCRGW
ncbi:HAD-like domain-containing protein [Xylogone sp. PMI_703]|nr:HAD-like domain-containing protein [Xylogone sp. PMI_703]